MTTLRHGPDEIVRQLFLDLGLCGAASWSGNAYTGAAWPVFHSEEPDKPDNCVTVYETVGSDDGRAQVTGERLGLYGINLRIRGLDKRTSRTKTDELWSAISRFSEGIYNKLVAVETSSYLVQAFSRIGNILPAGKEPESKRFIHTINCLANIGQRA